MNVSAQVCACAQPQVLLHCPCCHPRRKAVLSILMFWWNPCIDSLQLPVIKFFCAAYKILWGLVQSLDLVAHGLSHFRVERVSAIEQNFWNFPSNPLLLQSCFCLSFCILVLCLKWLFSFPLADSYSKVQIGVAPPEASWPTTPRLSELCSFDSILHVNSSLPPTHRFSVTCYPFEYCLSRKMNLSNPGTLSFSLLLLFSH